MRERINYRRKFNSTINDTNNISKGNQSNNEDKKRKFEDNNENSNKKSINNDR